MDSYNKFILNDNMTKGKLFIETDESDSEEWKLIINLTNLWKDYSNQQKSLLDFNNEYATILTENSEKIASACGDMCWNEIEPYAVNKLKEATNEEESETIYNSLYDIFDKYEINIKMDDMNNEIPTNV